MFANYYSSLLLLSGTMADDDDCSMESGVPYDMNDGRRLSVEEFLQRTANEEKHEDESPVLGVALLPDDSPAPSVPNVLPLPNANIPPPMQHPPPDDDLPPGLGPQRPVYDTDDEDDTVPLHVNGNPQPQFRLKSAPTPGGIRRAGPAPPGYYDGLPSPRRLDHGPTNSGGTDPGKLPPRALRPTRSRQQPKPPLPKRTRRSPPPSRSPSPAAVVIGNSWRDEGLDAGG